MLLVILTVTGQDEQIRVAKQVSLYLKKKREEKRRKKEDQTKAWFELIEQMKKVSLAKVNDSPSQTVRVIRSWFDAECRNDARSARTCKCVTY